MDKKAIRILIVGGQGAGKTTLALELARIMVNNAISVTIVDDGDAQPFRAEFDNSDEYPLNTIEVHQEIPTPIRGSGAAVSLLINLTKGTFGNGLSGYLPDELRQPIMDAAAEQIKWVNEKFPMRNGRVVFRAECEMSEEDKKNLIETSTYKKGGEVEESNPVDEGTTAKAFKRLAQELTELAERKKKRRELRTAIRSILILLTCAFFVVAIIMIARSGIDFLRALLAAITTGLLSSLFDND